MIENINKNKSIWKKINFDFSIFLVVTVLLFYGILMTWSASNQNIDIIERKLSQVFIGMLVMIITAQVPIRIYKNWIPYFYFSCIVLLILVNIFGTSIKGSKRWLNLGIIRFQPSEITKIIVPIMIAYFIDQDTCPPSLKVTFISIALIFLPAFLVAIQPDLGTSILIVISGLFVLFLSGLSWKFINVSVFFILIFVPILWFFLMHEYQRQRIKILFNPESDPLGFGYHIIQSKIAIGSGGFLGKGWLHGTQSRLEFLPERHTDFIFSVLAEELGMIGILVLFFLYLLLIMRGLWISLKAKTIFCQLIAGELILTFFIYIFVNIGMVSGILPVVGIPLPMISYGGSSLISLMIGFGIIMSIRAHKEHFF